MWGGRIPHVWKYICILSRSRGIEYRVCLLILAWGSWSCCGAKPRGGILNNEEFWICESKFKYTRNWLFHLSRLGNNKRPEAITFNNTLQVNATNASVVSAVQCGNLTSYNLRHLAPPSSIADVSMRSPSVALSTRSCSMGIFNKRPKSTGSSLSTIFSMVDGEVSTATQVSPLCSECIYTPLPFSSQTKS